MRFLVVLYLLPTIIFAADYPSCAVSKSKLVTFTTPQVSDRLVVQVNGSPCHEAKLKIRLETQRGDMLYEYISDFKNHTPVSWSDLALDKVAEALAESILANAIGKTSDLPAYFRCELPSEDCVSYERATIPWEQYKSLRKADAPLFSHPTYYEGWVSFIFDIEAFRVVKIYEGGV